MGLLSFLKRKSGDPAVRPVGLPESADSVQQARTRARQRLVGSVVLVAAGVIGFPLLFETQPRPLPGDTPIEIARRDGGAPATVPVRTTPAPRAPAATPPSAVVTETPAEAGREVAAASAVPVTPAPEVKPEPKPVEPKPAAEPKPTPKPEPKPEAKPEAKPAAEGARAQALLEGKPAASKPAATADGRFIVQVGAFAEVTAAREARQKVEKLGLKTYTQVVETSTGKRIRVRVGPFASRDEAEKASTKIKSAGLSSAVYTL
ncbi:SPOR domain-containing protein [Piscinibacter sp. HJYY11]|uniref:SPOR domain-containing protein n=1 Tax=Piscinibacter sp. HJYY11 TaxID=2801333 RepID=UPI00191E3B52|nr:SPOR domain-containing protein [Piscinibacter sp. HJYY11]MBL0727311.1 SPOR domain-containing protein [Piscinibacter sp. HJYY11]